MRNGVFRYSECEYWYKEDFLHREDGPAVISRGLIPYHLWYRDGKLHREDGPAMEVFKGEDRYYLDGEELTREEWWERISFSSKVKYIFSISGK